MTKLHTPAVNTIAIEAAPGVMVSYNRQFNLVEVTQGPTTHAATIVPDKYTLREFAGYVDKVKKVFV